MRVNNVVTNMRGGKMSYGFNLSFPSSTLVELAGRAGFDFVTFDSEHGPFTPDLLDDLCRFADMAGLTPMARVPNIESSTILRFLDRGIMGETGPHVTTGERARQLANACRYVPRGLRSFGSGRGAYFGDFESGPEYMEHTNANILVIAQLEDIEVLDNLDDIPGVDGIDLFASGAQDIAQSMGLQGQPAHQRVREFEAEVRDRIHAAGRKMADDVMASARAANIFLDGARTFLASQEAYARGSSVSSAFGPTSGGQKTWIARSELTLNPESLSRTARSSMASAPTRHSWVRWISR